MARFSREGVLLDIPLDQIEEAPNVREDYEGIEELAWSIAEEGLLQPVLVKALGQDTEGTERYELVAGHRRIRAVRHLGQAGGDFTSIKAMVVSGENLPLQLIENLQREDLPARDRERGIGQLMDSGFSVEQIAGKLSKSEEFVRRNVSGWKVRKMAERYIPRAQADELSTQVLAELQPLLKNSGAFEDALADLVDWGGTLKAAREIMLRYRAEEAVAQGSLEEPSPPPPPAASSPAEEAPPAAAVERRRPVAVIRGETRPMIHEQEREEADEEEEEDEGEEGYEDRPVIDEWLEDEHEPEMVDFNQALLVINSIREVVGAGLPAEWEEPVNYVMAELLRAHREGKF